MNYYLSGFKKVWCSTAQRYTQLRLNILNFGPNFHLFDAPLQTEQGLDCWQGMDVRSSMQFMVSSSADMTLQCLENSTQNAQNTLARNEVVSDLRLRSARHQCPCRNLVRMWTCPKALCPGFVQMFALHGRAPSLAFGRERTDRLFLFSGCHSQGLGYHTHLLVLETHFTVN